MELKCTWVQAASLSVAVVLSGCAAPGDQERSLNEQAAWASSLNIARDRPTATSAVAGPGGTVRLLSDAMGLALPPPQIAQVTTPPASAPQPTLPAPPAATSTTVVMPASAAPAPLASGPTAAAQAEAAADSERRTVLKNILDWRKSWMDGDVAAYIAHYDPAFKGDLASRQAWEKQRNQRLANAQIVVRIQNMAVRVDGDAAHAEFTQQYESKQHVDVGLKTLRLRKIDGKWLITEEVWRKG